MEAMIDTETWGKKPGCQIRSIGAVLFNPYDWSVPMATFYVNLDTAGQATLGMHQDASTVEWWSRQSWEAQAVFNSPAPVSLYDGLSWLFDFVRPATHWWAHGKEFDFPILEDAAERVWLTPPWQMDYKFRDKMDTRTIYRLARVEPDARPGYNIKHHAGHDAYNQAYAVQTAFSKLVTDVPNGVVPRFLRG